jgi:hypothetical protein
VFKSFSTIFQILDVEIKYQVYIQLKFNLGSDILFVFVCVSAFHLQTCLLAVLFVHYIYNITCIIILPQPDYSFTDKIIMFVKYPARLKWNAACRNAFNDGKCSESG